MNNRFSYITKITACILVTFISLSCNPPNTNISEQKVSTKAVPSSLPSLTDKRTADFLALKNKFNTKARPVNYLPCGDKYYIRIFNTDDTAYSYINSNPSVSSGYGEDYGYQEMYFLKPGHNDIKLQLYNKDSGYTWGFSIKKNSDIIYNDSSGEIGKYGANGNDQTHQNQIVYERIVPIEACSDLPTNQAYITDTEYYPHGKDVTYNAYTFNTKSNSCN